MARSSFGRSDAGAPGALWLRYAVGPFEGVVVGAACRAATVGDWPEVSRANQLLAVSLTPETLRVASGEMGEHLLAASRGLAVGQGYGHISSKCSGCRSGLASRRRVWRPGRVGGRLSP